MKAYFTVLFTFLLSVQAIGQSCREREKNLFDPSLRNTSLEDKLYELFQCKEGIPIGEELQNDLTACNWFVGRALKQVWHINDFWLPIDGRFMLTAEMEAHVKSKLGTSGWRSHGTADSQANLDAATAAAQSGKAVIALGAGHVALIIPGGSANSGTWGLNVPISAQMGLSRDSKGRYVPDLKKAWVGCRLSNGFGANRKSNIVLYSYN